MCQRYNLSDVCKYIITTDEIMAVMELPLQSLFLRQDNDVYYTYTFVCVCVCQTHACI